MLYEQEYLLIFSIPFKSTNSMKTQRLQPAPNFSASLIVAATVPPVANKSSIIKTF